MKKIKAFLLTIVILSTLVMSVFSLSSCKKTVTYQIAGLYIESISNMIIIIFFRKMQDHMLHLLIHQN